MQKVLVFCVIAVKICSQFKILYSAFSWCPHSSDTSKQCNVLILSRLSFGALVLGNTYTWMRLNSPFTQSLQKTSFLGKLWSSCTRFWVWILPFNWLEKLRETQKSVIREQLAELTRAWSVMMPVQGDGSRSMDHQRELHQLQVAFKPHFGHHSHKQTLIK